MVTRPALRRLVLRDQDIPVEPAQRPELFEVLEVLAMSAGSAAGSSTTMARTGSLLVAQGEEARRAQVPLRSAMTMNAGRQRAASMMPRVWLKGIGVALAAPCWAGSPISRPRSTMPSVTSSMTFRGAVPQRSHACATVSSNSGCRGPPSTHKSRAETVTRSTKRAACACSIRPRGRGPLGRGDG